MVLFAEGYRKLQLSDAYGKSYSCIKAVPPSHDAW
jgi:hypothetical protein